MSKLDDNDILEVIGTDEKGVGKGEILRALKKTMGEQAPSDATLKRRLAEMVKDGKIIKFGEARATKYKCENTLKANLKLDLNVTGTMESYVPMSEEGKEVREYVQQPIHDRTPVGYQREFLEEYEPNQTEYLSSDINKHLHEIGKTAEQDQIAGTYANDILNRLLIDLSWASSKLEGNTYTRLDTQNLIEAGQVAEGKDLTEATMILNHKRAIELLIENAPEIDFNNYTFLNLHGILSDGLLGDPNDSGRVRERIVDIAGTVYRPLSVPQQLQQNFDLILEKTRAINDPFEQSFFVMVHIPYLQPFVDVNKRVSRLGANISLIKSNLCPLSFIEVPEKAYVEGTLGVYELNNVSLLKDVFIWAYERSCQQYNAIRNTVAEPDPVRLKYRQILYSIIEQIVKHKLANETESILQATEGHVPEEVQNKFIDLVETELQNLHEGNLSRYRLRLSEFNEWKEQFK